MSLKERQKSDYKRAQNYIKNMFIITFTEQVRCNRHTGITQSVKIFFRMSLSLQEKTVMPSNKSCNPASLVCYLLI